MADPFAADVVGSPFSDQPGVRTRYRCGYTGTDRATSTVTSTDTGMGASTGASTVASFDECPYARYSTAMATIHAAGTRATAAVLYLAYGHSAKPATVLVPVLAPVPVSVLAPVLVPVRVHVPVNAGTGRVVL